jgi:hypothetical protein
VCLIGQAVEQQELGAGGDVALQGLHCGKEGNTEAGVRGREG